MKTKKLKILGTSIIQCDRLVYLSQVGMTTGTGRGSTFFKTMNTQSLENIYNSKDITYDTCTSHRKSL